jgi:DNA-binding NtrC family response regulator
VLHVPPYERSFLTEHGLKQAITLCRDNREISMGHTPATSRGEKRAILVVDDDAAILALVSGMLSDGEYNVLTASTGAKGLQQSRKFKGEIYLLLSDFQMPGMSGVDLATAMTLERPQLKVLLMSGFKERMLVLNEGWHFLEKPFVSSELISLVSGLVFPDRKSRFYKPAPAD